jgi:hypothetical protein
LPDLNLMRRVLPVLAVSALLASLFPAMAMAQIPGQSGQSGRGVPGSGRPGQDQGQASDTPIVDSAPRIAPLSRRANAGPCPYVKILYDAARYVELTDNRAATANVGYTGEIEGLAADCAYRGDEPITVQLNLLFNLGRGPMATADRHTYRYWIAVTERNKAILAKQYFDLPVDFRGAQTAASTEEQTIVIPRAAITTSGDNFEILIGFDVTPEMADFNRTGSRFRINAGQAEATDPQ